MLMLARIEQLQSPEGIAAVDLAQLLRTSTDLRRQQLEARHLACRLTLGAALKVEGDAFLLQQAILNLLDNTYESRYSVT